MEVFNTLHNLIADDQVVCFVVKNVPPRGTPGEVQYAALRKV